MTDSPPPAGGDDDVSLAQQPVLALSAASRAVAATRAGSTNWQWTVLRAAEVPRPSGRSYEDPPIEQRSPPPDRRLHQDQAPPIREEGEKFQGLLKAEQQK